MWNLKRNTKTIQREEVIINRNAVNLYTATKMTISSFPQNGKTVHYNQLIPFNHSYAVPPHNPWPGSMRDR